MKLLLFQSVHWVMQAENLLKSAQIPYEILPTPREYSKECGMCIGVEQTHLENVQKLLKDFYLQIVCPERNPN